MTGISCLIALDISQIYQFAIPTKADSMKDAIVVSGDSEKSVLSVGIVAEIGIVVKGSITRRMR